MNNMFDFLSIGKNGPDFQQLTTPFEGLNLQIRKLPLIFNGLRKTRWNCGLPIRYPTEKTGWKR
jgi:hypothetical protein